MAAGQQARARPSIWANHQSSRGRLVLVSDDPDVNPVIDENMLDDAGDRLRMRDAVKRGLELLDGDPFRSVLERVTIDVAGKGVDALASDDAIDQWLLETIGDTAHICGTCMGDSDDERSVVRPPAVSSASTGCRSPTPRSSRRSRAEHEPPDRRGGRLSDLITPRALSDVVGLTCRCAQAREL